MKATKAGQFMQAMGTKFITTETERVVFIDGTGTQFINLLHLCATPVEVV